MLLRSGQPPWQRTWFTDTLPTVNCTLPLRVFTTTAFLKVECSYEVHIRAGGSGDWCWSRTGRSNQPLRAFINLRKLPQPRGSQFWSSLPFDHFSHLHIFFTLVQLIPLLSPLCFFSSLHSPILKIGNFSICMDGILPKSTKPSLEAD